MKRASTLLPCCLLASFIYSQQLEWAEGFGHIKRQVNEVAITANGDIVALGGGLFVLDSQHQRILAQDEVSMFVDDFYQGAYEMADGRVFITRAEHVCDFPTAGGWYKVFGSSWNPLGNGPAYFFSNIPENSGKVLSFENDAFLTILGDPEGAGKVDAGWNLQWSTGGTVNDIALRADQKLLVATTGGIILYDGNGSAIEGNENLLFSQLKTNNTNNVVARQQDTIAVILPWLVLAQPALTVSNLIDYAVNDEFVVVLSGTPAGIYTVGVYDFGLNPLNEFTVTNPSLYFETIALKNDEIILGGRDAYTHGYAAIVKSYTLAGITENYGADAGVTDFEVGNTAVHYGQYDTLIYSDISVTIQNFGEKILEDCWVNIDLTQISNPLEPCPAYDRYFTHFYENLALAPGQSVTVDFPDMVAVYIFDEMPAQQNLCFWTFTPNHRIDLNHDNDAACQSITTTVKEPDWARSLSVFPNPVSDVLTLQFGGALPGEARYSVVDAMGRTTLEGTIEAGGSVKNISTEGLLNGFYWLKVEKGQHSESIKFIKVE